MGTRQKSKSSREGDGGKVEMETHLRSKLRIVHGSQHDIWPHLSAKNRTSIPLAQLLCTIPPFLAI